MSLLDKRYNLSLKLVFIPVVLVLIYSFTYMIDPYSDIWSEFENGEVKCILLEVFIDLLLSWAILEISVGISHALERRFQWTRSPVLRFILQTVLTIVTVGCVLYLQHLVFYFIYGDVELTESQNMNVWRFVWVSIFVSVIVSAVHTGYFFLQRWQLSMSEATALKLKTAELKEIAMQAELQSLKLQLDPHFMFNNFSTLSELINEDPAVASEFLNNLSRVYRYMIQNLKKDLVQLKVEIEFLKSYIYLMKIRHDDNMQVIIQLDENVMDSAIPPVTLQMLTENAIKHNIATGNSPLVIHIICKEGYITITNNLQRIAHTIPSTGMGLRNITDRYRILSGREPVIAETDTTFYVALPVLNL
ncbi:sensor histidine kinase [Chitinophaga oryziterrae]|uniref:Sensor histidine kinase n=2 Tax=Chitinophaga oryziterrae TaxID=1031224 RepID=A0A6N8J5X3_9BACT|nr:sensor histidine kinase [Chitinophaga oryziterrae]